MTDSIKICCKTFSSKENVGRVLLSINQITFYSLKQLLSGRAKWKVPIVSMYNEFHQNNTNWQSWVIFLICKSNSN